MNCGRERYHQQRDGREIVEILAELPDLWDVNVSDWNNDSMTSRFAEEGYQEPYVAFVKSVTSKPVVGLDGSRLRIRWSPRSSGVSWISSAQPVRRSLTLPAEQN
ncbi:MAG: hypothetical protein Ct9H300mP16_10830 [Pseudomonadota bacterium]|nr:MAG: hypothetical protein Ct9H300mP16_10830 [Pseudomonadota bacterium]